jgi:hypothetical protein
MSQTVEGNEATSSQMQEGQSGLAYAPVSTLFVYTEFICFKYNMGLDHPERLHQLLEIDWPLCHQGYVTRVVL